MSRVRHQEVLYPDEAEIARRALGERVGERLGSRMLVA
jgi:hypothetical protein